MSELQDKNLYISALCAGGMAGMVVDMVLFPLDTLKTRLQAAQGFWKVGGFHGVYRGLATQALGSAPQAALFFLTYETLKASAIPILPAYCHPFVHMAAASVGEAVSCLIRVPVDVVKQRKQTSSSKSSTARKIAVMAFRTEGIRGLYRGYGSTLLREVPFSFIQFPILEYFKMCYSRTFKNNEELEPYHVAMCGSAAGGMAAAITTPLDVVKTRIMLAPNGVNRSELTLRRMFSTIYKEFGMKGLFAGFIPRVLWTTLGGYIFFGVYDFSRHLCQDYLEGKPLRGRI